MGMGAMHYILHDSARGAPQHVPPEAILERPPVPVLHIRLERRALQVHQRLPDDQLVPAQQAECLIVQCAGRSLSATSLHLLWCKHTP